MKIIIKPSFLRDVERVNDKELKTLLDLKISQIEKAKSIDNITGLKLLKPTSRQVAQAPVGFES